jgi:hypothetical protein
VRLGTLPLDHPLIWPVYIGQKSTVADSR